MMGYFSNGTEGELYQEAYCDRCIHRHGGCAVWLAHMLRNYQDCNDDESVLHVLIPRSTDHLDNEECRMFLDEALLSPLARQQYQSGRRR